MTIDAPTPREVELLTRIANLYLEHDDFWHKQGVQARNKGQLGAYEFGQRNAYREVASHLHQLIDNPHYFDDFINRKEENTP
jgi:hypothetical protein|tara:strand:+ start:2903 stop:3148 length:246 start_codon:yes stop_codon:yes gene_type:complete